ncbi:GerAB/ArcD/ProY family transporter [Sporolactobacillus sp. CQH2019]|uniref:GerAB/ArcD/ProY family transporter n=1 Tax=Sporolactobacillus sp. CQH2019 TaxID=3023512 RepID=UPI002368CD2B|nr:GerAB/ArcD/ProY family transporter [Sporolactobacillus sp. CQH2019]MDD9150267.1 GerAB/ArcD/ProY family transporter [Sporolactobacillus sp. CQH2019]
MLQDKISETNQLPPNSAFFIPFSMQMGVGLLAFLRTIPAEAGRDAWITVILSGFLTLAIMAIIFRLLETERKFGRPDLFSIHQRLFGKWIGGLLNFLALVYIAIHGVAFLRTYFQVINVWIFPQLPVWEFSILFCLLLWYIVLGGIRVIGGICFMSFIILVIMMPTNAFAVQYAHFFNLLPLFETSPLMVLKSFITAAQSFGGFEMILFFYPFIKKPEAARKWGYFALLTSTYTYLTIMLLGLLYFNQPELQKLLWPITTYWKRINFPLFSHFDIIGIFSIFWILLPSIAFSVWAISRGIKHLFPIKQKIALILVLIIFVVLCQIPKNGGDLILLNQLYTQAAFYFMYAYIPCLFFIQWISGKVRQKSS